MTVINGSVICGRRGASAFIDSVLTDSITYLCPFGYEACSRNTIPSETTCVPVGADLSEACPIIDLFFIRSDQLQEIIDYGYETTEIGIPLTMLRNSETETRLKAGDTEHVTTHMAYTRTMGPQWFSTSGSPIMGTSINNSVPPCYGSNSEKLIVPTTTTGDNFRFTVEKEETLEKCPSYDWRVMDYMDIRYATLAQLSLYNLEEANGVFTALEEHLPAFYAAQAELMEQ